MKTLTQTELVEMNKKVVGKIVYTEGIYGAQCVGWFKWLCSQLQIPVLPTGTGFASGYWTTNRNENWSAYFEFITDYKKFQDGDIVIFPYGGAYTPYSHICMKIGSGILSQNQSGHPYVTWEACSYFNTALGAFRYKGLRKKSATAAKKSLQQIAKEVIDGKWGNGAVRKNKLTAAGYDYATVQALVNQMLNNGVAVKTQYKVGAKVKIVKGAKDLNTNAKYADFVYKTTYIIKEVHGSRIVFGTAKVVIGAVTKDKCQLV